jgi:hypothetical protein
VLPFPLGLPETAGLLSTLGVLTQECQGRCPLGAAACPQTPCRQPANDEVKDLFTDLWEPVDLAQTYVPRLNSQEPVLISPIL